MTRVALDVRGAVQGVGFRPFIFRLATDLRLTGWVRNCADGVQIEVEGPGERVEAFVRRLAGEAPPLAQILEITRTPVPPAGDRTFVIAPSEPHGPPQVVVLPDLAICPDCLRELHDPADRRYRYPFINCTHCGPRYSIITALPYDRLRTTMAVFALCPSCRAEYDDPRDRRFHAEPTACPVCGPHVEAWDVSGRVLALHEEALRLAAEAIRRGKILALKGLGGFQLLADASDADAVARLRARKGRPHKPFALMYPTMEAIRRHCRVSALEEALLRGPAAPIVLLQRRDGPDPPVVADGVAPGRATLGAMLPYTALHVLLLEDLGIPVVATSGNLSDEPICTEAAEALARLGGVADLFLVHNRPIARPVDDSVVRVIAGEPVVLRAARGYAPLEVPVDDELPAVLALGGHLKSTVAVGRGRRIVLSQHIGDLETELSRQVFERTQAALTDLYALAPEVVARDLHPDYASTRAAQGRAGRVIAVQHHHAHVLSAMAESRLRPPALGVAWDGTGYGPDGTVWGGEFIRVTGGGFTQVARLRRFSLPGGEAAVREPRRSALGVLYELYGDLALARTDLPPVRAWTAAERRVLGAMLRGGVNTPRTSSAGRLFDAIASLLDLAQRVSYEGQAAAALEDLAAAREDGADAAAGWVPYPHALGPGSDGVAELDWGPMISSLLADLEQGTPPARIAARVHATLAEMIVAVAQAAWEPAVILTGGCFQNATLATLASARLAAAGFRVVRHRRVPPNDGGLAVGQALAVAAGRWT